MTAILVAENDLDTRQMLQFILLTEGYEVRAESDGDATLDAAREMTPDLVLLDWMIPSSDGIEVCLKLRTSPKFATTPIVIMSGRTKVSDVQVGLLAGADDYITKPFGIHEFAARVAAALSNPPRPYRLNPAHPPKPQRSQSSSANPVRLNQPRQLALRRFSEADQQPPDQVGGLRGKA